MKKWVIILPAVLIAAIIYYLNRPEITEPEIKKIQVNTNAFSRTIVDENLWKKWWPGKVMNNKIVSFSYNNFTYELHDKKYTSAEIKIYDKSDTILSELTFVPQSKDTILLTWNIKSLPTATFTGKIKWSKLLNNLKKDMAEIMNSIDRFYNNEDNIYGIRINKAFVKDSMLISTAVMMDHFPSTEEVYALIEKLQNHAKKNNAVQTDYPMLNIYTTDSVHYRTQVALPLNKKLNDDKDIVYRWMLGGGNILISETQGGYNTINKGFKAIESYVKDNARVAPAIPFQQLVTDRRSEPDTTKWKTLLCWPVM